MADSKVKKSHRERKNPHAAQQFAEQRHARNAARPKQKYDLVEVNAGTDKADLKVVGPYRG
jgi:hypothetical protein